MRDLNTITTNPNASSILALKDGKGFIACSSSNWGTAQVDIQYKDSQGNWQTFSDADGKTADFQYTVDTGGVAIVIRAFVATGTASSAIQVDGGVPGDEF
jgi:hypothetical protein